MTVSSHIESFFGLELEPFDKSTGIKNESLALRIEVDYEAGEDGERILSVLQAVAADSKAGDLTALVIGSWEEAFETSVQPLIDFLVAEKETFKRLKALFVGEMTYEENEISWIQQGDYSALWEAYPQLEHFQCRGMEGLSFGKISLENLKTLIIETGGLDVDVVRQIGSADLPVLKTLEIWFGDEGYGWNGSIEDIGVLLNSDSFSCVTHLGLKNCEIADEVAQLLVSHPLLKQLKVLDLAMGNLSDVGAKALLDNKEQWSHLESLNLSHHYLSDGMMNALRELSVTIDLSDQNEADADGDRYIEVSE